jgi:hypothetical protein
MPAYQQVRIVPTFVILLLLLGARAAAQEKPGIKITLSVEKEGPGGQFSQSGIDLTDAELATLRSNIEDRILKLKHDLVPEDYSGSHLFLSIVAEKLQTPDGKTYYLVSSALSIGKKSASIGSITHDVIVEPTIDMTARAVTYYLSAVELQGALGNIKD